MDITVLVPTLVTVAIIFCIFLIIRALMLWYWKIDIIVDRLYAISNATETLSQDRRKQHRIDYYVALAADDKKQAYLSLINVIIDDVLKPGLNEEQRKEIFAKNKERFEPVLAKLGYPFPQYELLF